MREVREGRLPCRSGSRRTPPERVDKASTSARCSKGIGGYWVAGCIFRSAVGLGRTVSPNEIIMVEKQIGGACANNKTDSDSGKQPPEGYRKKFTLRWDFWNNHA